MKKQFLLAIFILIIFIPNVEAQKSNSSNSYNYTTALGMKIYPGVGAVTFKHFLKETQAIEALGYFWNKGGRITGLYEFYWDINGAPGLKWYVGPGAHFSFYNDKYHGDDYPVPPGYKGYAAFGIDGVLGLDYKFGKIPLNLSVDWQPYYEFGDQWYYGFNGNFGGVAARYTF